MELTISNAEMTVMRVIWALGKAKAEEVIGQVEKRESWSASTIRTYLGRLVNKGALLTDRERQAYIYHPTISANDVIPILGREILGKICETKQPLLLANLIEQTKLTESDVAELIHLLSKKKTANKINCTCLTRFGVCNC